MSLCMLRILTKTAAFFPMQQILPTQPQLVLSFLKSFIPQERSSVGTSSQLAPGMLRTYVTWTNEPGQIYLDKSTHTHAVQISGPYSLVLHMHYILSWHPMSDVLKLSMIDQSAHSHGSRSLRLLLSSTFTFFLIFYAGKSLLAATPRGFDLHKGSHCLTLTINIFVPTSSAQFQAQLWLS